MTLPTQAAVTRAVKAAIKGAHELGYRVSSYEVVFNQGVPTVRVTTGAESPPPPVIQTGALNHSAIPPRIKSSTYAAPMAASRARIHARRQKRQCARVQRRLTQDHAVKVNADAGH